MRHGRGEAFGRKLAATAITLFLASTTLCAAAFAGGLPGLGWRRHLGAAIAIAIANNIDNLTARLAFCLGGARIGLLANLWVSVITFGFSAAAAEFGTALAGRLGRNAGSMLSMAALVLLGLTVIVQALRRGRTPLAAPPERRGAREMGFWEVSFLGVALSLNNIGGGASAGVMGIDPILVGLLSALLSFLALWAGNSFADRFARQQNAEVTAVLGGLLLIAVGVDQIL